MNQAAPIAPRAAGPQRKAGSKTAAVAADAAAKAQAAAAKEAAKVQGHGPGLQLQPVESAA